MMKLLGKYSFIDNVKLVVLLKFFTYIFLIWNLNCDMSTFDKSLEMKYKQDGSLNICCNRLLAKQELINNSYRTHESQKYANYGMNKNIKSEEEKKSIHSHIKGDRLNKIDYYIKDYKIRYYKKKGIAKLDCYYENKVLKKINDIFEITDNMKNKKKYYNKKIYNKYLMSIFLLGLLPFPGTVMSLLFGKGGLLKDFFCFSDCDISDHQASLQHTKANVHEGKDIFFFASATSGEFNIVDTFNTVFLWLSFFIVLLVLLYILIKVIKYARIKSGKCKIV